MNFDIDFNRCDQLESAKCKISPCLLKLNFVKLVIVTSLVSVLFSSLSLCMTLITCCMFSVLLSSEKCFHVVENSFNERKGDLRTEEDQWPFSD